MAIKNPKKVFNFRIQFIGGNAPTLPVFSVQNVTLPDKETEADEHGHGNTVIKTAGLSRLTSNAVLERILPSTTNVSEVSKMFHDWAVEAQDPIMGTGMDESTYKRTVLVHEIANNGVTVIGTTVLYGCWPTKINGREYKRAESGNLVETVELAVDYLKVIL